MTILDMIRQYDTIVLHRHNHPDGDALGSQIGLKHLILENFPGKTVCMVGDSAGRYGFMEDSTMDLVEDSVFPTALSIILDCGAETLISDDRWKTAAATARMDHHVFSGKIADEEIIDVERESCCGMIVALARENGLRFTPLAARSLYTGMVTDSGRFRYDCTTAETLRDAAFLLEQGVDLNEVYLPLYADSYESRLLRAQYTLKIRFTDHHVGYIYTTREEMEAMQADTFAISRGMVGVMSDIQGVNIWVNFTETDKGVLCELRSSDRSVVHIATKYGGGGHDKACGATVPDRETAMQMLADLDTMMQE